MKKPSSLSDVRHLHLTGDYNTEQVILGLARACAERGDEWQAVPVQEVETGWGGRPDRISWDLEAAEQEWARLMKRLRDAGVDEREPSPDPRAGLLGLTTAGRFMCQAVEDGWVQWANVGGQLGFELTDRSLRALEG